MTVTITLSSAGTDTGAFNLYSDANGYSPAFATNISRAVLLAGYTSTNVPNGTTSIRVTSTGNCTNSVDIPIQVPDSVPTPEPTIYPYCDGTTRVISASEVVYESLLCGGSGSTQSCLVEGTEITMIDGSIKKIEDLTTLDKLKSLSVEGLLADETTNETWTSDLLILAPCEVSVIKCEMSSTLFVKKINDGLLTVTDSHVHLAKQQGQWGLARTSELSVGDSLVNEFGVEVEITNIESVYGEVRVYDLGVEDNDLYIANGILTHNK